MFCFFVFTFVLKGHGKHWRGYGHERRGDVTPRRLVTSLRCGCVGASSAWLALRSKTERWWVLNGLKVSLFQLCTPVTVAGTARSPEGRWRHGSSAVQGCRVFPGDDHMTARHSNRLLSLKTLHCMSGGATKSVFSHLHGAPLDLFALYHPPLFILRHRHFCLVLSPPTNKLAGLTC